MSKEKKTSKPFYKKWWVWVIAIVVLAAVGNTNNGKNKPAATQQAVQPQTTQTPAAQAPAPAEAKAAPLLKIQDIANKSEQEVEKVLGKPNKKAEGKFRYAGTNNYLPAPTVFYKDGAVEVKFVEGKAARITVTPKDELKYPDNLPQALELVGLSKDTAMEQSERGAAFSDVNGIYSGQIFPENNKVSYLYFIVDKKYK